MDANVFSLVINGGSFALICYIVMYAWPKAVERLTSSHDKTTDTFRAVNKENVEVFQATYKMQSDKHEAKTTQMLEAFAREQKYERDQCDRHHQEAMNLGNKNHEAEVQLIRSTAHEFRGILQPVLNAMALNKTLPKQPTKDQQHGG